MHTITNVASAAGVSTATVSRVLNGNARVAPELAARVHKAVEQLGYQPSRVARSLRTQQSKVWFLIVSDVHNPFFTDLLTSIEDRAYTDGYTLVLCNAQSRAREDAYLQLALAEQASGIVLVPRNPGTLKLDPVLAHNVPVVVVDQRYMHPKVDRVLIDNIAGAEAAVNHLVENGYERIAFIGGPAVVTTATERLTGYKRALAAHNRRFDRRLARYGDFKETGGYKETRTLLELRPRPDALVVINNMMTVGALNALRDARVRIPRDIGVVGFDETPWASLIEPPLTTVGQPTWELGAESARLLLSRIAGYGGEARETVLAPSLIIRGSSAAKARPSAARAPRSH